MRKTAGALSFHMSLWGMDERLYMSDILSCKWVVFFSGSMPTLSSWESAPPAPPYTPKTAWSKYLELYLPMRRSVKMNQVSSPCYMNNHCKIIVETYTFSSSKRRQRLIRNTASDNKNQSFPTRLLCVLFSSSSATFPIVHCWEFWFFIFATHAHTSVAHVWSTDSILEPNVLLNGQSRQSIPLRVRFCLWWIASKCNGVIKRRNLLIGIALKWTVSSPKIPYGHDPWRYGT